MELIIWLVGIYAYVMIGQVWLYWLDYACYHQGSIAQKVLIPLQKHYYAPEPFAKKWEDDKKGQFLGAVIGIPFGLVLTGGSWLVKVIIYLFKLFFGSGLLRFIGVIH
ncbi:hypothetical protein MYX07_01625 [Patescibacteria group bacterium AH-259-L07]|nr:hypothetical protein [Patescibacteria group bacterium AH-259-L07]